MALGRPRQARSAAAGELDDRIEAEPLRLAPADRGLPATAHGPQPLDRAIECDHAATIFETAAQRQHVAVTVDNAGFWRVHRGDTGKRRLEALGRRGIDDLDSFDVVDLRLLKDRFQPLDFAPVTGADYLTP